MTGENGWTVYILRCADDTLYTGITNDLTRRIDAHNAGKGAKYTRARGPAVLVYHETCIDKGAALTREAAIKALSRQAKLALVAAQKTAPHGKRQAVP